MRVRCFLLCLICCLLTLQLSETAAARAMKLTIHDHGISCPAGCDAHFVMNGADNGTTNARQPGTRDRPKACVAGASCEICFTDLANSCTRAVYRGGGPPVGTFDFAPAFYDANCPGAAAPAALQAQCKALDAAAARLDYGKRTNCLAHANNPICFGVVKAARAAQAADIPKRQMCLKDGEAAYNTHQTDPKERRTNACNYSLLLLGGSAKKHWHLLLPAARRFGTCVDQFGLDCCSQSVRFAAANHPECVKFFPL